VSMSRNGWSSSTSRISSADTVCTGLRLAPGAPVKGC
jgi:hypothetical protein